MTPIRWKVAHYQGGKSDKVYILFIIAHLNGRFEVFAKWARRGKQKFLSTIVGDLETESEAITCMNFKFAEKLRKGYLDVEDLSYSGPVTADDVQQWMLPIKKNSSIDPRPLPPLSPPLSPSKEKTLRVRCLNNLGIECQFLVGEEYDAEKTDDDEMLEVLDLHNEKVEVFTSRFERVG